MDIIEIGDLVYWVGTWVGTSEQKEYYGLIVGIEEKYYRVDELDDDNGYLIEWININRPVSIRNARDTYQLRKNFLDKHP